LGIRRRETMTHQVDSFRFVDFMTRKVVEGWVEKEKGLSKETPREIPWAPLDRPLSECRVALISSGGIALKTDKPFDGEIERRDPWRSDPSFRILPQTATEEDVEIHHLHIDPNFGHQDLNCVLPLQRLAEFESAGEIGSVAPRHYSFMGYTTDASALLENSVPSMIQCLQEDEVDLVVLVPI
jgi:hypothetical protein